LAPPARERIRVFVASCRKRQFLIFKVFRWGASAPRDMPREMGAGGARELAEPRLLHFHFGHEDDAGDPAQGTGTAIVSAECSARVPACLAWQNPCLNCLGNVGNLTGCADA
jgi:hypothetical protein